MQRRSFIHQGIATGSSVLLASTALGRKSEKGLSPAQPFRMDYAFHDGMFKNHGGNDFIDQIKFAHDKGFRSIEDNGMMGRPVEQQKKIGDTLAQTGNDDGCVCHYI